MAISRGKAVKKIYETDGKIFGVEFIKRTNGDKRVMSARLHVKKYLTGGGRKYDFEAKDLIPVFDMKKKAYRVIPIEAINRIAVAGKSYIIN